MKMKLLFIIAIMLLVTPVLCLKSLHALEEALIIAHEDVFGSLQRPSVVFPHDLHMEVYADQECGICHHSYDEISKSLTYEAGDETGCSDCHMLKQAGNAPALREAFHGSCTICHRKLIKEKAEKSGPTTCGECHKK